MKTEMYMHEPESVSFTLVLTMEVGDWRKLHEQLGHAGLGQPALALKDRIDSMLSKADMTFIIAPQGERSE